MRLSQPTQPVMVSQAGGLLLLRQLFGEYWDDRGFGRDVAGGTLQAT